MKTLQSLVTASALALAAAQGAPVISLSVKPEREIIRASNPGDLIIQVELTAKDPDKKRTAPVNLAFVLDRSGSMAGAKLEKARQAAGVALDQLGEDDIFSLVVYDDEVEVLIPPQKVKNKEELKRVIQGIRDGGSTALYAGVEKGAAQLRKYFDSERVNRVVLLSDGLANVGLSSPSDLAKLGKELRKEGMSVSTIGLGDDYNEDLMTSLAEASHANYYYVKDAEKLPGIFKEELKTAQNVVARNVNVTITLPKGVKPKGLVGDEEIVFKGQSVTIPLSEFFGSQRRRFLVSCEAPDGETALDVAQVTLAYEDAGDGKPVKESQAAQVRRSDDTKKVESSVQAEVAANAAIIQNRLAKEQAVKLADSGRAKDAANVLLQQATANAQLPAAAQSEQLKSEDGELRRRAEELQNSGGWSRGSRKAIQYENYQDKNQKR